MAEAEVIKDSPDSPEPPNKKPLVEMDETPHMEKAKGKDGSGSQGSFQQSSCFVQYYITLSVRKSSWCPDTRQEILFTALELKTFFNIKKEKKNSCTILCNERFEKKSVFVKSILKKLQTRSLFARVLELPGAAYRGRLFPVLLPHYSSFQLMHRDVGFLLTSSFTYIMACCSQSPLLLSHPLPIRCVCTYT